MVLYRYDTVIVTITSGWPVTSLANTPYRGWYNNRRMRSPNVGIMKRKKSLIAGSVLLLGIIGIGVLTMDTDGTAQTKDSSEIPFTQTNSNPVTASQPTLDTQPTTNVSQGQTTQSQTTEATGVTPTTVPTVFFSASNNEYPGTGRFDLPSFTTTDDWSMNFDFTCDTGTAFAIAKVGVQQIMLNHPGTVGPFSSRAGIISVNIPEGQNCTWTVSAS